jgi:hypothetical protein
MNARPDGNAASAILLPRHLGENSAGNIAIPPRRTEVWGCTSQREVHGPRGATKGAWVAGNRHCLPLAHRQRVYFVSGLDRHEEHPSACGTIGVRVCSRRFPNDESCPEADPVSLWRSRFIRPNRVCRADQVIPHERVGLRFPKPAANAARNPTGETSGTTQRPGAAFQGKSAATAKTGASPSATSSPPDPEWPISGTCPLKAPGDRTGDAAPR